MKTKLINGRIYDGNGGKPFYGELAFADDTILAVGTKLDGEFDTVIDVGGKAICPGFIDTHPLRFENPRGLGHSVENTAGYNHGGMRTGRRVHGSDPRRVFGQMAAQHRGA